MEFTYCKLIDVLSNIHSGGTPSTRESSYWGGKIKWLSSGETSQRFISDTIDKITDEGVKNSSTKLASKGSIVMACAGQGKTRGQTSYLLDDMYINQSVIALETNESVLPLYLFYDLSSRYEELRGGSDASSTRGSITTTSLKNLSFKYPDLSTQQSIVDILWGYDSLIEANNRRIELLEQAAQELYKEWFVRFRFPGYENAKFEDGIPEGWECCRLGKILSFGAGKTRPKSGETYPVYGGNGILDYCNNYNSENAIIIGRVGVYCGTVYYEPDKCWISDNALFAESKNSMHFYNYYLLKNMNLNARQIGTGQPLITQGLLNKIRILLPSESLMMKYNQIASELLKQQDLLRKMNVNIVAQRDMLLPRLMSGKLEV